MAQKVELVFQPDCPNVEAARQQLRKAFDQAQIEPRWDEWNRRDPGSPAHIQGYGSPTIIINGSDVAGTQPSDDAESCCIYASEDGSFIGVPPIEAIVAALLAGVPPQS